MIMKQKCHPVCNPRTLKGEGSRYIFFVSLDFVINIINKTEAGFKFPTAIAFDQVS